MMTVEGFSQERLQGLLAPVIAIAQAASREILKVYNSNEYNVSEKADHSPLTAADMAAHHIIVDGLQALTPELPILSEESAEIPFSERRSWQQYWLVDPLDGTREFVKRNGEFTVNIALIENHRSVLGVIDVPVTGVGYYAAEGSGAWKRETADQQAQPIHVRQYQGKGLVVAGSRSHASDTLLAFLAQVGDYELVSMGSSLKSCLVAEGVADIYPRLGPTSEWDTAASHCIVNEAGGSLTDTAMQPLRYNTKESLLNPSFFVSGNPAYDWSQYLPGDD